MLQGIFRRVGNVLRGRSTLDEDTIEELEAALVMGDVSAPLAMALVEELRERAERTRVDDDEGLLDLLREIVFERLKPFEDRLVVAPTPPSVWLVLGVNGVGKTTTIAKLAAMLKRQGMSVLLAAGDTFRAAAVEQLQTWAGRIGIDVVAQGKGADPGAVMFDALDSAKARGIDFVIADTAGRLHTKVNLMEELRKMGRIVERANGRPADERLLVLDANTGQNAINQAREFNEAIGVTGLAITKLDSTAKGGALLSLTEEMQIPIKLVGVGERMEDLVPFSAREFADGIV
ncbi:MAG TPA: signal recognition particle-docking protein FtsY, partial [Armatimonadetes bacterium]|nr:signal recognition particle-docking protein FtsY [Armatimonadota bacterium]